MSWQRPSPSEVWQAIEAYLAVAYEGAPPPAVAERLSLLRAASDSAFYECEAFERAEGRFALRLGNRFYAHMKLVVETLPDGAPYFRADTHDRHVLELVGSGDPRLTELTERNQAIARAVEQAWSGLGLPTPREHWREKLARWHALHRSDDPRSA